MQSEPIGAGFNLLDGVQASDMDGLADYDLKFRTIASYGLVHANAAFFFPTEMSTFISQNGGWSDTSVAQVSHGNETVTLYDLSDDAKAALDRLSRYWVARFGAFPVMWTLGQEVDNDFYWDRENYNGHREWSAANNPYHYVAERIAYYDAYHHPLSAHQESVSNTTASDSSFREINAHTWYAAQWSQKYNEKINLTYPKDYWNNGQGKPVVNYEGKYCFLWTKNFGARVQGWMAYLSGMFGASWGAQDMWNYQSTYDEDDSSNDGVDLITSEEKQEAVWEDALSYRSTYQLCYMRTFFEEIVCDWHTLLPRFDNTAYFTPENNLVFYLCASNTDHSKIVLYFYQFSDPALARNPNATAENAVKTGTVSSLTPNGSYRYIWYNPVTGQIDEAGNFTASSSGTWSAGNKTTGDMVLYIIKEPVSCLHAHTASFTQKAPTCIEPGCDAHVFCTDCGNMISGSLNKTAQLSHTPGSAATCTTDQKCTVCHTVLQPRFGHDLIETVTGPTCTEAGVVTSYCTQCDFTQTITLSALGHQAIDVAKLKMGETRSYLITKSDESSLFREMPFSDGYTNAVTFYVYNDSNVTLSTVAVNYNWGYRALDDAQNPSQIIPSTQVNLNVAPHT
ncbi:MAG: DUF4038 domain-containing protein, partial [Clostridia bacterium]|nr:DUF4038 domain-containing protein [Clostridia bacterium]